MSAVASSFCDAYAPDDPAKASAAARNKKWQQQQSAHRPEAGRPSSSLLRTPGIYSSMSHRVPSATTPRPRAAQGPTLASHPGSSSSNTSRVPTAAGRTNHEAEARKPPMSASPRHAYYPDKADKLRAPAGAACDSFALKGYRPQSSASRPDSLSGTMMRPRPNMGSQPGTTPPPNQASTDRTYATGPSSILDQVPHQASSAYAYNPRPASTLRHEAYQASSAQTTALKLDARKPGTPQPARHHANSTHLTSGRADTTALVVQTGEQRPPQSPPHTSHQDWDLAPHQGVYHDHDAAATQTFTNGHDQALTLPTAFHHDHDQGLALPIAFDSNHDRGLASLTMEQLMSMPFDDLWQHTHVEPAAMPRRGSFPHLPAASCSFPQPHAHDGWEHGSRRALHGGVPDRQMLQLEAA